MKKHALFITLFAVCLLMVWTIPVLAQTPAGSDIILATNHPAIVADKGQSISFSIDVINNTTEWQELELKCEGPSDWNPVIKSGGYTTRRIMVGPEKSQSVELQVKSPETAPSQDYSFVFQALHKDGRTAAELRLDITLREKVARTGLKFSTQYPESRGQAGGTFSFRLTLSNESDQDRPVNFSASAPSGWNVTFKVGYESRQVTTMSMKGSSTQDVTVDVSAPQRAEAGDYEIIVRAEADGDVAEQSLKVGIIGSYRVSLTTASGQLNTEATVDKETKLTLIVRNTGTAPLQNLSMSSSRPDGWEITFTPDKIEQLPVDGVAEVNVSLKPSSKVLAGDYMISMSVYSSQASDSKEIRVTVETPTSWGIAAIAAIVIVLGGLGLIFARFSRR